MNTLNNGHEVINLIEPMTIGNFTVTNYATDAYTFKESSKHHWLQKVCLWILKKLNCYASFDTVETKTTHIGMNGDRFMDKLLTHHNNLLDMHYTPTKLLIGSKQYYELMMEPMSHAYFNFDSRYYITEKDDYNQITRQDKKLKIEVIPWMNGMVLLP